MARVLDNPMMEMLTREQPLDDWLTPGNGRPIPDEIGLPVIVSDDRGNFIEFNNELTDILGYDREYLLKSSFSSLDAERDAAANYRAIASTDRFFTFADINGQKRGFFVNTVPVEEGRYLHLLVELGQIKGFGQDIPWKENSRQSPKCKSLLEKFSLIGEMSTCLAHEVRNPMTTVRGLAQLMAGENPAQAETFQLMVEEVDRANRLIGDFLMLSRNYISSRETVLLLDLVQSAVEACQEQPGHQDAKIETDLQLFGSTVYGDKAQIEQALARVLNNAVEACGNDRKIVLRAATWEQEAFITVIDRGVGIDEMSLKRVLDPFFTTKEGHSGLGLSIAYKIIKDHQGDIMIDSVPGRGTTVEIRLPLYQVQPRT